jgi:hypothetical protein
MEKVWWWHLFSTRSTCFSWIFIVLAHWNSNQQEDMSLRLKHYHDSDSTSLCFLILHVFRRNSKYQFHSLSFEQNGVQSLNLPHFDFYEATRLTITLLMSFNKIQYLNYVVYPFSFGHCVVCTSNYRLFL